MARERVSIHGTALCLLTLMSKIQQNIDKTGQAKKKQAQSVSGSTFEETGNA
jgi:hypothetical protein